MPLKPIRRFRHVFRKKTEGKILEKLSSPKKLSLNFFFTPLSHAQDLTRHLTATLVAGKTSIVAGNTSPKTLRDTRPKTLQDTRPIRKPYKTQDLLVLWAGGRQVRRACGGGGFSAQHAHIWLPSHQCTILHLTVNAGHSLLTPAHGWCEMVACCG